MSKVLFREIIHAGGERFLLVEDDLAVLPAFQREFLTTETCTGCMPIRIVEEEAGIATYIHCEDAVPLREWVACTLKDSKNPAADIIRVFIGLAESLLTCEDRLLDLSGLALDSGTVFVDPYHGVRVAFLRATNETREIVESFLALFEETVEASEDPAALASAATIRERTVRRNVGLRGILGILNRTARDQWGLRWPEPELLHACDPRT